MKTYLIGHLEYIKEWVEMNALAYSDESDWLDLDSGWSLEVNRSWIDRVVREVKNGTAELVMVAGVEVDAPNSVLASEVEWIKAQGLEYDKWSSKFVAPGTVTTPDWHARADKLSRF